MRPVVFVAGPLRSPNPHQVAAHILTAQKAAEDLASCGCAPYVPHCNVGHGLGVIHEADAEAVNLSFLRMAHALYALPGAKDSVGARLEIKIAAERGIPILVSLQEVRAWRASLR